MRFVCRWHRLGGSCSEANIHPPLGWIFFVSNFRLGVSVSWKQGGTRKQKACNGATSRYCSIVECGSLVCKAKVVGIRAETICAKALRKQ
jgi:hypothetical protein